jgi:hypothetical protein
MALAPRGGRGKLMFFLRIDKIFPNEQKLYNFFPLLKDFCQDKRYWL